MTKPLEGQVAIVTGAARGIGRAIALRLAHDGAAVTVDDVDDERGEATVAEIVAAGGRARYVHADVSQTDEIKQLVSTTEFAFGPITTIVNNALPPTINVLENTWDPLINVCLKGPYLLMNEVLPGMVERRSGSIINISSVNALAGFGSEHVYSAAKAGLIGMSRSMAVRYGRYGIRINVICPGTIVTETWGPMLERDPGLHDRLVELYPAARLGEPDDIAGAAAYLAGPDSRFTTGSVMVVDGGITAGYVAFSVWDE